MTAHPSTTAQIFHAQTDEKGRFLPEGPRTITLDGRVAIAWVNIQTAADSTSGEIHVKFLDTGEHLCFPQEKKPGFLFPTNRENTLFVGREKEVGLLNLKTNRFEALAKIHDEHPRTIINDGEIVPGGKAVVFGTKDVQFAEQIGHLYLYTVEDGILTELDKGHTCSNGKIIYQEGEDFFLLDIDTPRQNVIKYSLSLTERRLTKIDEVLDLHDQPGFPDGMISVEEKSLIIAFYNPTSTDAGHAIRFDLESGLVMEDWRTIGSPRVTCPLLFNRDGEIDLILTTADEGMTPEIREKCPNAGHLFIAKTSILRIPDPLVVQLPE